MRTDEPRTARSRRTVAKILDTTRTLIEERGFEAVTMAAVAERAGVSRRAIYLHFGSRTDLLVGVFNHIGEQDDLPGSLRELRKVDDPVAALDEYARHLSRFHVSVIAVSRAIERARHNDEVAARLWNQILRNWRNVTRPLAQRLADAGLLAPEWTVPAATDMLCALTSFELTEYLIVQRKWSRSAYADHLAALFRSTFVRAVE